MYKVSLICFSVSIGVNAQCNWECTEWLELGVPQCLLRSPGEMDVAPAPTANWWIPTGFILSSQPFALLLSPCMCTARPSPRNKSGFLSGGRDRHTRNNISDLFLTWRNELPRFTAQGRRWLSNTLPVSHCPTFLSHGHFETWLVYGLKCSTFSLVSNCKLVCIPQNKCLFFILKMNKQLHARHRNWATPTSDNSYKQHLIWGRDFSKE